MFPLARLRALTPPLKLVLGSAALSLALFASSLLGPRGPAQLARLRTDIARQEAANKALRDENLLLQRTVKALSPPVNARALEKAAREELGFVQKDEVIFKFE